MAIDEKHDPVAGEPSARAPAGAGAAVNPTDESGFWRVNYRSRPYYRHGTDYDSFYAPAYQYGWESATRPEYRNRRFDELESELARGWAKVRGNARIEWNEAKHAARDAFERVRNRHRSAPGVTRASE